MKRFKVVNNVGDHLPQLEWNKILAVATSIQQVQFEHLSDGTFHICMNITSSYIKRVTVVYSSNGWTSMNRIPPLKHSCNSNISKWIWIHLLFLGRFAYACGQEHFYIWLLKDSFINKCGVEIRHVFGYSSKWPLIHIVIFF